MLRDANVPRHLAVGQAIVVGGLPSPHALEVLFEIVQLCTCN
jgi:hypothetical protein